MRLFPFRNEPVEEPMVSEKKAPDSAEPRINRMQFLQKLGVFAGIAGLLAGAGVYGDKVGTKNQQADMEAKKEAEIAKAMKMREGLEENKTELLKQIIDPEFEKNASRYYHVRSCIVSHNDRVTYILRTLRTYQVPIDEELAKHISKNYIHKHPLPEDLNTYLILHYHPEKINDLTTTIALNEDD